MRVMTGKIKLPAVTFLIIICLFLMPIPCKASASNSWKIENASYHAPELKAYLYGAKKWDSIKFTAAQLTTQSGEKRSLQYVDGGPLNPLSEGTEYIYLVDITKSMRDANLAVIRQCILEHLDAVRGKDRLIVYVFSGKAEKILHVTGERLYPDAADKKQKKAAEAEKKKAQDVIERRVQKGRGDKKGSAVYEAMEMVMDYTAKQDEKIKENLPLRKVCLLLTDGLDRDFGSTDPAVFEEKIRESHVAFYGMRIAADALEQAASKETLQQLETYCGTSGGDWVNEPRSEQKVYRALTQKRTELANCYLAVFQAENNLVSNAQEELTITTEDNRRSSRTILANKYQADNEAPKAKKIKKTADNSISFVFSEAVTGTQRRENFIVKDEDDRSVKISSVSYDADSYQCEIVFDSQLYSGKYTLEFKNVTDYSMEKNAAKKAKFDFEGKSRAAGGFMYAVLHFWWVIVLAVLAGGSFVIYQKLKEQGGVIIQDGKASLTGRLQPKVEAKLKVQTQCPYLYMTLTQAGGKTSEICLQIEDSVIAGRLPSCNISIDDPAVSGQHFVIEMINGRAYISDLNSKNGTFVNNTRITQDYLLKENDRIKAGQEIFVFHKIQ